MPVAAGARRRRDRQGRGCEDSFRRAEARLRVLQPSCVQRMHGRRSRRAARRDTPCSAERPTVAAAAQRAAPEAHAQRETDTPVEEARAARSRSRKEELQLA